MTEPIYRLEKLDFDGPLSLLLGLIEKNKVDIFDIPITLITEQYLEYVSTLEEADMEIMSSFLVMATTLLDIKAKLLLPQDDEKDDEDTDPREALVRRLIEYRHYKYISKELKAYEKRAREVFYRDEPLKEELKKYVPGPNLDELLDGLNYEMLLDIYERLNARFRDSLNTQAYEFDQIKKESISIVECINKIKSFTKNHERFLFSEMFEAGSQKDEVIVSFLAVLELMKLGKITARQRDSGSDIRVRVLRGADLDELDLSEIVG